MKTPKDKDYGRAPTAFLYRWIAIPLLLPLVARFFRLRARADKRLADLEGPIVAIGHHTSYLDQFAMAKLFGRRRVNFVGGAFLFKNPSVASLFKRLGVIPKTQFRSDSTALKSMLKVMKRGGVLGIFPEATRSLDGTTIAFDDALARLIKKSNSAVVVIRIYGGYSTWPRWSKSGIRKGYAEGQVHKILTVAEVQSLSAGELQEFLQGAMAYNEYDWLRENPHEYKSKAIAAGVENVAFLCPACLRSDRMRSSGDRLFCEACGNAARMTAQGFFVPASEGAKVFADLHQWVSWEREWMRERVSHEDLDLAADVVLCQLDEEEKYRVTGKGRVRFSGSKIVYEGVACELADGIVLNKKLKKAVKAEKGEGGLSESFFDGFPVAEKSFDVTKMRGMVSQYGEYFELIEPGGQVNRFFPEDKQIVLPIQMMMLSRKEQA